MILMVDGGEEANPAMKVVDTGGIIEECAVEQRRTGVPQRRQGVCRVASNNNM